VEIKAIVKAFGGQIDKVFDRLGSDIGPELELDVP
jgi:hypothetical protein